MAIVKRSLSSILGLSAALAALQSADAAETAARNAAITAVNQAIAAEAAARIDGDNAASAALGEHIAGPFADVQSLLTLINGSSSVTGSFRQVIADVVGNAPEAFNTLKEIADFIQNNPSGGLADAIAAQITAAKAEINGTATTLMDTFGEVEAALNTEVSGRVAALTALETALKAYADNAASAGGALPTLESVVVAADRIVLSHAPKGGIGGVMNFATARYIDNNGVAFDAQVLIDNTDTTGKTLIVSVDTSGEWDGKTVQVQYLYVA